MKLWIKAIIVEEVTEHRKQVSKAARDRLSLCNNGND